MGFLVVYEGEDRLLWDPKTLTDSDSKFYVSLFLCVFDGLHLPLFLCVCLSLSFFLSAVTNSSDHFENLF